MIDAPLALAFTAGMIASINPCGFALLPAYVGAFVAGDDTRDRMDRRIARAIGVSATVSIGFAVMFVIVGVVFSTASNALRQQMPWVTIVVGIVMVAMGIASIIGWKPMLPFQSRMTSRGHGALGMATFGFAYALVSLSCTLGPFLSVSTFAMRRSFVGGIATYLVYAAGMGVIILALSVSAALAHDSLVGALRNVSRYASRLAGVLLLLSGGFAIWYGRFELAVYAGDVSRDSIVELGTNLQTRFIVLTQRVGAQRIALLIIALTAGVYVVSRLRRRIAASSLGDDGAITFGTTPAAALPDRATSRETTPTP